MDSLIAHVVQLALLVLLVFVAFCHLGLGLHRLVRFGRRLRAAHHQAPGSGKS